MAAISFFVICPGNIDKADTEGTCSIFMQKAGWASANARMPKHNKYITALTNTKTV